MLVHFVSWEGGLIPPSQCEKAHVLRCCVNGDFMEGRVDNVRYLNLGRALDKSCHRLQHLRIDFGVVSFGIGFVCPQTDCCHVNSAGTAISEEHTSELQS